MGEKQKYLMKSISYDGIFNYRELFRIIDVWLREHYYDKWEKRNEQYKTPEGFSLDIEFTPWKKVTDYHKLIMKIEISGTNLKEVEVELNGKKEKMHEGKLNIKLTGYLVVDYEHKWNRPVYYFIRDVYDKYVYWRITKKYIDMVIEHVDSMYNDIRSYLNVTHYKV